MKFMEESVFKMELNIKKKKKRFNLKQNLLRKYNIWKESFILGKMEMNGLINLIKELKKFKKIS